MMRNNCSTNSRPVSASAGNKDDPNNWRPISICSVIRRIIERTIDRRLNEFVILNENQVGFTKSPGTYLNAAILNACLIKAKKEKLDCCAVLLDVQKAFEESGHEHIKCKMEHTLMPSRLRNLTMSLLEGNTTQLHTMHGTSPPIEIKKGVFQGLPLSPKMFNISSNHVLEAVNEAEVSQRYGFKLHDDIPNVSGRGFADDMGLVGNSEDSAVQLTKIAWNEFDKVGYKLNFDKCIAINIKKGQLVDMNLNIDGHQIRSIQPGEVIKYLGVTFEDEIVFKPEILISKFNKDLQNLIGTPMLYPHQKLSIINQYLWPTLVYSLQNAPLNKLPKSFLESLDKMIRTAVKSIIGLPHDTPNAMLYASKKVRGLQLFTAQWEAFIQHYNICLVLLNSTDKFIPYCKDLNQEMEECLQVLQIDQNQLQADMRKNKKTKPAKLIRQQLREKEYDKWCSLPHKGVGVEVFQESKEGNQIIMDKNGLTNSEWVTTLKMQCNVVPVRSVPGRSLDTPLCRKCPERETLSHVLGSCQNNDLLRNSRHHEIRGIIARHLREKGWTVHEELHCVAEGGSNRRVDIWCYKENLQKGYIIDPTVRMETSKQQAKDVNDEKRAIYEPCVKYFKRYYNIQNIEVIGLLVGARGTITEFFNKFRKDFKLPKELLEEVVIAAIRGSCKIIYNHLYKP